MMVMMMMMMLGNGLLDINGRKRPIEVDFHFAKDPHDIIDNLSRSARCNARSNSPTFPTIYIVLE